MPASNPESILVGIDVGGTFTDFVLLHNGRLHVHKVPTTPDDQSRAIVTGLSSLPVEPNIEQNINRAEIVHGMTVATNALLERSGARTALLTTAGFADVLVIGRQNRPHLYRLSQSRPAPLVANEWRLEVAERLDHAGNILLPLDETQVGHIARQLANSDVESLAIVFLFAFRNPAHEQRAAELIRAHCPDLPISLSSQILPEYREYERTSTTVINAYVQPLVSRYLHRLARTLAGSKVRIMQSNGGAIGLEQAATEAARVVLSGPAGGVVGAFDVARQALDGTLPQIITFDMGGTSTDVALCPGAIPTTAESAITDLPLRLPVIDIHTVGAGGGSIAYLDAGGGLRVGPRSAGAVPGPASYGRGGTEPTVTDANLLLGRLDPGGFLGGKGDVALDIDAARAAIQPLADRLDLSAHEAALGIIRIANATMERALRRVSVERGYDPRRFTLLPFGGAGPLHVCELATALGVRQVLVPPIPGVLSAYGMLVADVASDAAQSLLQNAAGLLENIAPIQDGYRQLDERVRAVLAAEGIAEPAMQAALDMRYAGQSYELTVPLALPITTRHMAAARDAFHAAHEQRYGYAMPEEAVNVVNIRARGTGPGPRPTLPDAPLGGPDASAARLTEKEVWFTPTDATVTSCYARDRLQPGNRFAGPALVFQFDSTSVIPPGWSARVDRFHNLWLEKS